MKNFIFISMISLLVFAGCTPPVTLVDTPQNPNQPLGRLSVQIPAVADWLAPFAKNQSESRALLRATSVVVYVQTTSGTNVISPVTQTLSLSSGANSTTVLSPIDGVPVGSNYEVSVYVYNSAYSTYNAVVAGMKTGVAVNVGATTNVAVTCLPVYPDVLVTNVLSVYALAANSEAWFQLSTLGNTEYTLTQSNVNTPTFLFTEAGVYIATVTSTQPYVWTPSTDTDYYIGVSNVAATDQNTGTLVSAVIPLVNEGSVLSPVQVDLDTSRTFTFGPSSATDETSYYWFTTDEAGDYYLDLPSGYFNFNLYSNSSFTTLLQNNYYVNSGTWLTGLAASTTYYLSVENGRSTASTWTGELWSPDSIAAATRAEGSPSSPIALSLSAVYSGQVGYQGIHRLAYYSFTTGDEVNYSLVISNVAGGSTKVAWSLGQGLSYATESGTGSSVSDLILEPNTTYRLTVAQYSTTDTSSASQTTFDVQVSPQVPPVGTTLVLDTPSNPTLSGSAQYFNITLDPGTYNLWWEDAYQKNAATVATVDVKVSAYTDDFTSFYFLNYDSGYSSPPTITIPAGSPQTIRIVVKPFGSGYTGTYWIGVSTPSVGSLDITVN